MGYRATDHSDLKGNGMMNRTNGTGMRHIPTKENTSEQRRVEGIHQHHLFENPSIVQLVCWTLSGVWYGLALAARSIVGEVAQ